MNNDSSTIGSFIAALRRAKGLTQAQLGEMLGVSDKSVSRWERDETVPDLTLIPAIADIFGVTADELLRGRRSGQAAPETLERRSRVQAEALLRRLENRYSIFSLIAPCLSCLGLIAALLCNFAFNRGLLGLFIGCCFFLAAVLFQAGVFLWALGGAEDSLISPEALGSYRRRLVKTLGWNLSVTACLLAFCLPLGLNGAYTGLMAGSLFPLGLAAAVIAAAVCGFVSWCVNAALVKRGFYPAPAHADAVKALRRRLCITLAVLLVLALAGEGAVAVSQPGISSHFGRSFQNWDDFKAYMEQPVERDDSYSGNAVAPAPVDGTALSEDDLYPEREVTDDDGNVLCRYRWKNGSVSRVQYGLGKDLLPVWVQTSEEIWQNDHLIMALEAGVAAVAVLLALIAWAVYERRKYKAAAPMVQ